MKFLKKSLLSFLIIAFAAPIISAPNAYAGITAFNIPGCVKFCSELVSRSYLCYRDGEKADAAVALDYKDDSGLSVFNKDGSVKYFEIDTKVQIIGTDEAADKSEAEEYIKKLIYKDGVSGEKNPFENRVIYYKARERKIYSIEIMEAVRSAERGYFDEETGKIEDLKIGSDTVIIDAVGYKDNEGVSDGTAFAIVLAEAGYANDVIMIVPG